MSAKLIKPLPAELMDAPPMRLTVCALDFAEMELHINSSADSKAAFFNWHHFCARMFLRELGKNPARN